MACKLRSRLLLLSLTALLGCGSSSSISSTAQTTSSLSGNWEVVYSGNNQSSPFTYVIGEFVGNLQFSNGTVTGTFEPIAASATTPCISSNRYVTVTGTIDAANNLTLTAPVAGGTATITATLPDNSQTMTPDSYQIVGGNCPNSSVPMKIMQFGPVTGTYTGTVNEFDNYGNSIAGTATTITASLTQSTTPDAYAEFPVTGTITATGACTDDRPLSGEVQGSVLYFLSGPFAGSINPTASTIGGVFIETNSSSSCFNIQLGGTLTRQ